MPGVQSSLFASAYMILIGIIAWVMYRKGWIVKI